MKPKGRSRALRRKFPLSPRPNYLLREMFGWNHADSRFLYVSDGGHYENLGLVELLRRGCTTVWCVDASGEGSHGFPTLAEAVGIARSEIGVDIEIDPDEMSRDPSPEDGDRTFVRATHVKGKIFYRNGVTGTIVFIRAGVTRDAPIDVRNFHAKHPTFPNDPTLNQLFGAERFDAYRSLGYFTATRALDEARPIQPSPVDPLTVESRTRLPI